MPPTNDPIPQSGVSERRMRVPKALSPSHADDLWRVPFEIWDLHVSVVFCNTRQTL